MLLTSSGCLSVKIQQHSILYIRSNNISQKEIVIIFIITLDLVSLRQRQEWISRKERIEGLL